MLTDLEILDGIAGVARDHLEFEGDIALDTRLMETMELDSIRLLTLVVELENHFQICLDEGDEDGVETVADLVAVLRMHLGT